MKGYILDTIEDYDMKQQEIAEDLSLGYHNVSEDEIELVRYAGRLKDGVVFPDIILDNGKFFIPYPQGTDQINTKDLVKNII